MPSDLTTSDILTRLDAIEAHHDQRLDAMEARSSTERGAIRAENRYLTGLMILVIAALAGVQVHYAGLSLGPSTVTVTQTATPEAPAVEPPAPSPLET